MAITIQEIQKQWGISRATVYKHIKAGKLSRLADGHVDLSEVLRVYGEPKKNTGRDNQEIAVDSVDSQENKLLLDKIAFLESQLAQAEKREEWLRGQVETAQETIKLLEHKQPSAQPSKKGLLGRLLGAINND
jgi:predicted transcriptional regulator